MPDRNALGRARRVAGVLIPVLLLGGCAEEGFDDLRSYVERIKSRKGGTIQPLPEFKTYQTFTYRPGGRRDPFEPREEEATVVESRASGGVRPDVERHREALEEFPLDSLSFVGVIRQGGRTWGVITAPDGLVYRVSEGNHIGQNYGRIDAVSETEITLTEIVPDGRGGWIEREAALALAE